MNRIQPSKHIFLSGGTGFFGKSLLSMVKRNEFPDIRWTVLSRDPERFIRNYPEFGAVQNVCFIEGDVRNFKFPEKKFQYIIHAAAPTGQLPPEEVTDIILNGTKRMIDFAHKCCAERLLFVSSGAVYGTNDFITGIRENTVCRPTTAYGIAKYKAEQICLNSGIPVVIARCFSFTGPYLDKNSHFAVSNFIRNCLEHRPIEINGTGLPQRSFLFADDLVKWLLTILLKGKNGEVYNVGSDESISIAELAKVVRKALNSAVPIVICGNKDTEHAASYYIPDISKCRCELGLSVEVKLCDAIRNSVKGDI